MYRTFVDATSNKIPKCFFFRKSCIKNSDSGISLFIFLQIESSSCFANQLTLVEQQFGLQNKSFFFVRHTIKYPLHPPLVIGRHYCKWRLEPFMIQL